MLRGSPSSRSIITAICGIMSLLAVTSIERVRGSGTASTRFNRRTRSLSPDEARRGLRRSAEKTETIPGAELAVVVARSVVRKQRGQFRRHFNRVRVLQIKHPEFRRVLDIGVHGIHQFLDGRHQVVRRADHQRVGVVVRNRRDPGAWRMPVAGISGHRRCRRFHPPPRPPPKKRPKPPNPPGPPGWLPVVALARWGKGP